MTPPGDGLSARDVKDLMSEGFGRIEDRLTRLETLFQSLTRDYVLWRDFEHSYDQQKYELAAVAQQGDKDIASVRTEIRDMKLEAMERAKEARTVRWTVIGLVLATAVALPSAVLALAQLLH